MAERNDWIMAVRKIVEMLRAAPLAAVAALKGANPVVEERLAGNPEEQPESNDRRGGISPGI
jgi:hypothetical protein